MTDPLTSPDCDLRGMLFMPLDVQRLLDSDLFVTATGDEFKAAVALWCKSWSQVPAASLPNDDRVLASYSGARSRSARQRRGKSSEGRNAASQTDDPSNKAPMAPSEDDRGSEGLQSPDSP